MTAAAYRLRPWLFLIAALAMVGASWRTLGELPYRGVAHAVAANAPVQRVQVLGEQWDWRITPTQVTAGQPVNFHVTSKDVNHDFALYDESLHIVAQVQAMPGFGIFLAAFCGWSWSAEPKTVSNPGNAAATA